MSAIGPGSADQVVSILRSNWFQACCTVASSSFVLYDHAITLPSEVSLIWGRKWSSVSLLFYLNRWATFIWAVVQVPLDMLPLSRLPVCIGLLHFTGSITFLLFGIWAVFSSVRIYALSGGNRWLALIVLLLNLVPVATNIYSTFANWQYEIVDLPVLGNDCYGGSTLSQSVQIKFTIGTRVCVIVADVMVLVVTWIRTYSTYRHARIAHARTPLMTVVLRDGTIHFLVLLLLNVLNMIGLGTNIFVYVITYFSTSFSSVIITHFLLNLRQTSSVGSDGNVAQSCTSSVQFASGSHNQSWHSRLSSNHSFVDNMGAELDYESDIRINGSDIEWSEGQEDVSKIGNPNAISKLTPRIVAAA